MNKDKKLIDFNLIETTNMKAVLFDFDGVLVNTFPMCWEVNKELNSMLTFEEYKALSDGNYHAQVKKIYSGDQELLQKNYFALYRSNLPSITITPELKELLKALSEKYLLFVVTSCTEEIIEEHLAREGVKDLFKETLGYNFHKSKKEKFLHILKKYSLKPNDTIFITDTLGDVLEANEVTIPTIAVTWGLHDRERLQNGNPKAIIDTISELTTKIDEIMA